MKSSGQFLYGLIMLTSTLMLTQGCELLTRNKCLKGEGNIVEFQDNLSHFSTVVNNIPADVTIIYDTNLRNPRVYTFIQNNLQDVVSYNVESDRLIIDFEECLKSYSDIRIDLYVPSLSGVESNSSGSFYFTEKIVSESFSFDLNETGDIDAFIKSEMVTANGKGTGSITINGLVKFAYLNNSGVGDINCFSLLTDTAYVVNTDAGETNVFADKLLDVKISGIGNVNYKGRPSFNENISGIGELNDSNPF